MRTKKPTRKELLERARRDFRQHISDKAGHSRFKFALEGKLWNIERDLSGFATRSGHWVLRAWGWQGQALCGETIIFQDDPIINQNQAPAMRHCCRMRLQRIHSRIGASRQGD